MSCLICDASGQDSYDSCVLGLPGLGPIGLGDRWNDRLRMTKE
jgi:hypothetical protein